MIPDRQNSAPGKGGTSSDSVTLLLHLEEVAQSLNQLGEFDPGKAIDTLWSAFVAIRSLVLRLNDQPCRLFLVAPSTGKFGRDLGSVSSPFDFSYVSALSGMLKSITAECPAFRFTVVDVDKSQLEEAVFIESLAYLLALGAPEQEYSIDAQGLRVHTLVPCEDNDPEPAPTLAVPAGILALGGARGISVSVLETIGSKATKLILTGRSALHPPDWVKPEHSVQEIRLHLIKMHAANGEKVSPSSIEKEVKAILSSREASAAVAKLAEVFGSVDYLQLDLLTDDAAEQLIRFLDDGGFQFDTIMNVAGVIEDSLIAKKSEQSFNRVLRTKLEAQKLTYRILGKYDIQYLINFASIAGKTGNFGQVDYAAANELVNAGTWLCSSIYRNLRAYSINWGPWASAGMATKEVSDAFIERGIFPIPLDLGSLFVKSLISDQRDIPLEVTVGLYDPSKFVTISFDFSGAALRYPFMAYHAISESRSNTGTEEIRSFKLRFDCLSLPYLQSHRKFGRPVMPAAVSCALALETYDMASALSRAAGDHEITRICTEVLSGIVFDKQVQQEFVYQASRDESGSIQCILRGSGTARASYRTSVERAPRPVLSQQLMDALKLISEESNQSVVLNQALCYKDFLFHDGVFEVIASDPVISDQQELIVSTLKSHGLARMLGVNEASEGSLDPSLLDGLLQLGLVVLRRLYKTSALPNKLIVDVFANPQPDTTYLAVGRIVKVDRVTSKAFYEGLIIDKLGNPLLSLSFAEMTHSESMID